MLALLVLGFLVGLDNFLVSTGVGAGRLDKKQKWLLVCGFAFFEAFMPLSGLLVGQALAENLTFFTEFAGPVALVFCGVLLLSSLHLGSKPLTAYQRVLPALPLLLSFDNLSAGAGFGALDFPLAVTAIVVGGISGCMCFAGLLLGEKAGHLVPVKAETLCGVWLVCAAVFLVF